MNNFLTKNFSTDNLLTANIFYAFSIDRTKVVSNCLINIQNKHQKYEK